MTLSLFKPLKILNKAWLCIKPDRIALIYPTADTSSLEQEIDQLVYELYGLTEEEIKIVEGGV